MEELLQIINNNITTNSNNEITASVLRNVLKSIADKFSTDIGELGQLQTNNKSSLTKAINEVLNGINNGDDLVKRYGTQEPTSLTFSDLSVLDFYVQTNNNSLWVYTGSEWVRIINQQDSDVDLTAHNQDLQAHTILFNTKVDKVQGKGLSTNDYNNEDKGKLLQSFNGKINFISSQKIGNDVTITLRKQNNEELQATFNVGNNGISEAPNDNKLYGRKNGNWEQVQIGLSTVNWNDIQGKPNTFTPSQHTHTIAEVTNLQQSLDNKADVNHNHNWSDIQGKPSEFNPTTHTHPISQVTGLQVALNNKADVNHIHTLEPLEITQNTILTATHNNRILMIKGNISLTLSEGGSAGFTGCGIDVVEGRVLFGVGQNMTLTGFSANELNKDEKGYVYRMKQGENNFRLV